MVTEGDLREIASRLPGCEFDDIALTMAVRVKGKLRGFAWSWKERIDPKRPKVPNMRVLAVRVSSLSEKDIILGSDERKFFTEPHYNGNPAVLVRLDEIERDELEDLLVEGYRMQTAVQAARKRTR